MRIKKRVFSNIRKEFQFYMYTTLLYNNNHISSNRDIKNYNF